MTLVLSLASTASAQMAALHHYCSNDPGAPTRSPEEEWACKCLRHPAPQSGFDTSGPDWYAEVDYPDTTWPDVRSGCFDVTATTTPIVNAFREGEMAAALAARAEVIAHLRTPHNHHWESNNLHDAAQYPGCGGTGGWPEHVAGWDWLIADAGGVIAGFNSNGRGNVTIVVGRDPVDWRNDALFVVLDTGRVYVLPGPHTTFKVWTAP